MANALRTNKNPKKPLRKIQFIVPPTELINGTHGFIEGKNGVKGIYIDSETDVRILTTSGEYTYHGIPYIKWELNQP